MSPEFATGFFTEAIKITILLSAPMLIAGLIVGLIVSILQAATQVNEMTMTFIPKMLAVGIAILIFFPWMVQIIVDFTHDLFVNIPTYIH